MDAQAAAEPAIADAQRDKTKAKSVQKAAKSPIDKVAKLAEDRFKKNLKRREDRKIAKEAKEAEEAAKPVDAKDVKRKETNKKHREWCKRKREEIKEASAFADNILTPAISPHI